MKDTDKKSIERLIYYCDRLQEHVSYFGNSREEFFTNKQYQDACSLVIIQIGEFVGRLSDEFKDDHPEIPWNDIKGMRNIHDYNYDNVMFDLVWESISEDLPYLKEYLEQLIY